MTSATKITKGSAKSQKTGMRGGSPEFLDEAATMPRPDGTLNDRDGNFDGM